MNTPFRASSTLGRYVQITLNDLSSPGVIQWGAVLRVTAPCRFLGILRLARAYGSHGGWALGARGFSSAIGVSCSHHPAAMPGSQISIDQR
jgi:hypothetical protein